jgi:hypothetical protein
MKNVLGLIVFSLFSLLWGINVMANNVVKTADNYRIVCSDTPVMHNEMPQSWLIEYAANTKFIEITKHSTKRGEEYIVRHEFFEIRYLNTSRGFGVRKVKRSQQHVDPVIVNAVINQAQMEQQYLLWNEKLSEVKVLDYIASFVPFLLNEQYTHLLN